jgi:hypothetical protein
MKKAASAFVLALLTCVSGESLFAARQCRTQDFNGAYGILARGAVTVPGFPITGPFVRAGQVVADGKGKLVFNTTASYNGILFSEAIQATYTVAPDCSMVFTVQPFEPINQNATFRAFLSDDNQQVDFIITVPLGQTISAVLKKQRSGACTERSLSGPYTLHMTGNVVTAPAGLLPGQFVRVGRFTPDGRGHFTAATTANYNGFLISPEDFSGTYIVASNCTVSIRYTFSGVPYLWTGALVENGDRVDLVVSTGGFAVAGELTQLDQHGDDNEDR